MITFISIVCIILFSYCIYKIIINYYYNRLLKRYNKLNLIYNALTQDENIDKHNPGLNVISCEIHLIKTRMDIIDGNYE